MYHAVFSSTPHCTVLQAARQLQREFIAAADDALSLSSPADAQTAQAVASLPGRQRHAKQIAKFTFDEISTKIEYVLSELTGHNQFWLQRIDAEKRRGQTLAATVLALAQQNSGLQDGREPDEVST